MKGPCTKKTNWMTHPAIPLLGLHQESKGQQKLKARGKRVLLLMVASCNKDHERTGMIYKAQVRGSPVHKKASWKESTISFSGIRSSRVYCSAVKKLSFRQQARAQATVCLASLTCHRVSKQRIPTYGCHSHQLEFMVSLTLRAGPAIGDRTHNLVDESSLVVSSACVWSTDGIF